VQRIEPRSAEQTVVPSAAFEDRDWLLFQDFCAAGERRRCRRPCLRSRSSCTWHQLASLRPRGAGARDRVIPNDTVPGRAPRTLR
jgi:hypothetical protein